MRGDYHPGEGGRYGDGSECGTARIRLRSAAVTIAGQAGADTIEREAARSLADALASINAVRQPQHRQRHRALLEHAIDRANHALAVAGHEPMWSALAILAKAHAARAEDALHGAGQLSLSAQRAPTSQACDEGWGRVESIAADAEESAREAAGAARTIEKGAPGTALARAARKAAGRAETAARAARRIVDERNHAYTFHTDHGFSFGEGWYLAAAALLGGAVIQIEPGTPATAQAELFLRDAGLAGQLQQYCSRPRANKQTTDIVARAFRTDPLAAQRKLRGAFLGDAPIAMTVRDWIDPRLDAYRGRAKILVWVRDGVHHPGRNTKLPELVEITRIVQHAGLVPVLVGDAIHDGEVPTGAVDLLLFWKDPVFRGADARRAQLQFFEHLQNEHGVIGQIGVTTAGMDGPALMGLPTMYLTGTSNVRMREWVGAVPGYREVVRENGYLDDVSSGLAGWVRRGGH